MLTGARTVRATVTMTLDFHALHFSDGTAEGFTDGASPCAGRAADFSQHVR
jgi:hypothetical protein